MIVVVFQSRLRANVDVAAFNAAAAHMYELASAMPGFVSYKDFAADDGEFLSLVEFSDEPSVAAWARNPEHAEMQERGRNEFMSAYRILVCRPLDELALPASDGDPRIVGIFRSGSLDASLESTMQELIGFASYKRFVADDGEQAEIVEFSDGTIAPALLDGSLGADGYRAQVCTPLREHVFQA